MDTGAAACGVKQAVSPQVLLAQMQQDFAALLPFDPEVALDRLALDIGGGPGQPPYGFGGRGGAAEAAPRASARLPVPRSANGCPNGTPASNGCGCKPMRCS